MFKAKKTSRLVLCILLFSVLCACSFQEHTIKEADLEAAAISTIQEKSNLAGEWKLVERQETQNGVFFFYQNGSSYCGINFYKLKNGSYKEGLCSVPTKKTTKESISEGSLYENGVFTYVLLGQKPENAKELLLTLRDKNEAEIKTIRVPLDSASQGIYYGYQLEYAQALHVEYKFI